MKLKIGQTISKMLLLVIISKQLNTKDIVFYSLEFLCYNKDADVNNEFQNFDFDFHFGSDYDTLAGKLAKDPTKDANELEGPFGKIYSQKYKYWYNYKNISKTIQSENKPEKPEYENEPLEEEISVHKHIIPEDGAEDWTIEQVNYYNIYFEFKNCIYVNNEAGKMESIFLLTEKLDGKLGEIEQQKIYELEKNKRYKIYNDLISQIVKIHFTEISKTIYPEDRWGEPYTKKSTRVLMNISLETMMYSEKEDNISIKIINYRSIKTQGEACDTLEPENLGYIHPNFYKKKIARDQMDVYALILAIAKLEYGNEHVNVSTDCEKEMTPVCLTDLKTQICNRHEIRFNVENPELPTSGYIDKISKKVSNFLNTTPKPPKLKTCDEYIDEANASGDNYRVCENLLCLILRQLQMEFGKTQSVEKVKKQMFSIYNESLPRVLV